MKFDFYMYDAALNFLKSRNLSNPLSVSGLQLKELLIPYRISAEKALEIYRTSPEVNVGHTVHMIMARK